MEGCKKTPRCRLQKMLALEAERRIKEMTETLYGHSFPWKHTTVYFEEDIQAGIYKYDCCGFVARVLDHVNVERREQLFKKLCMKPGYVPSPQKYTWFFQSISFDSELQQHWSQATSVKDVVPGTLLAWTPNTIQGNGSNGHIVIALTVPVLWEEDEPHAKTEGGHHVADPPRWYKLKIADSTKKFHTEDSRADDPRAKPNGTLFPKGGQGTGTILISEANRHMWVRWSASKTSTHVYGPVYGASFKENA